MKTFSINRFYKTLRWLFSMKIHSLMMWMLGLTLMILFIDVLFTQPGTNGLDRVYSYPFLSLFLEQFVLIGLAICIAHVFLFMSNHHCRQSFLMLPASNLEKYLAAVVFAALSGIVLTYGSVFIGDTLRVAFCFLIDDESWRNGLFFNMVIKMFNPYGRIPPQPFFIHLMGWTVLITSYMWLHSFFTLGGTLFRRHAFVLTSLMLMIGTAMLVLVFRAEFKQMITNPLESGVENEKLSAMTYLVTLFYVVFSVVNYWLSYRIFKRAGLISYKWFNV